MSFYPKLAWEGMRKNKRLYLPFILTCVGMAAMYYIICYLANTSLLESLPGYDAIKSMMQLGSGVLSIFAVLFLFYTNAFLIRRRNKEFGLYNILGMGKRNIGYILCWETLFTALISLAAGLAAGVGLSKLAELVLVNIMDGEAAYSFAVSVSAIVQTAILFGVIFLLLLLNGIRRIRHTNPVALLGSENVGEKPPKANWVIGVLGLVILAAAYYMAVTIKDPVSALAVFFLAVAMVIVATYMLFVSGSVTFCRLLQKNRRYYYKPNHFVSVASMTYRMKRNGAGLASICILLTMVLVMISASACLFFGAEDGLMTRYPREMAVQVKYEYGEDVLGDSRLAMREEIENVAAANGVVPRNVYDYRYATLTGMLTGDELETSVMNLAETVQGEMRQVYFIPLEDYNAMLGTDIGLLEDETLLYALREDYPFDSLTVRNGAVYHIREHLSSFPFDGNASMDILPSLFLVVPDMERVLTELGGLLDYNGGRIMGMYWSYGFDTGADEDVQRSLHAGIREALSSVEEQYDDAIVTYSCESRAANRDEFYGTYGGIFFLGILLSIVFLFATVLIIYYKQVSEGYEDQSRFAIMRKVGMTRENIKKNIHSQMLTVFLLPLIMAGLHLIFAFPIIRKLLTLFNMVNVDLFVMTTLISVAVFALLYTLVYRMTSSAYYQIVSGVKEARE